MFNKAKKSIAWLIILALAFAITAGYFASVQFVSAVAPDPDNESILSSADKAVIISKVEYGNSFKVPFDNSTNPNYTTNVRGPNGEIIKDSDIIIKTDSVTGAVTGNLTADQLGIYEVTLQGNGDSNGTEGFYKYNIESYIDSDYFLSVYKGGATIPTVWQLSETQLSDKKTSINLEVPDADVYQYDDNAEVYLKNPGQSLNVRITKPDGTEWLYKKQRETDGSTVVYKSVDKGTTYTKIENYMSGRGYLDTFCLAPDGVVTSKDDLGIWFFTYYTEINGGTEIISHEYKMQVQQQFEDIKPPSLSVSGVSRNASINTKVTLPTADVSDNFDERVILDIAVKHNGEDVPVVIADTRTGYVTKNANKYRKADGGSTDKLSDAASALFDNDKFMYFYPVEEGDYSVTYQARDNSNYYNVNTKTNTVVYTYNIAVTDVIAPVVDHIDDWKIPSEWGMNVYRYNEQNESEPIRLIGSELNIEFPVPEVYDNKETAENVVISFNMIDSKGNTVAYFDNINVTNHANASVHQGDGNLAKDNYYFFDWEKANENNNNTAYTVDKSNGSLKYNNTRIGYDFRTCFNFGLWTPKYTGASKTGTYSLIYHVVDSANNQTTLNYSIKYSDTYKDTVNPYVYFSKPNYLSFSEVEQEYSISDVAATDSGTSRVHSEYYFAYNVPANVGISDYSQSSKSSDFNIILNDSKADRTKLIELDSKLGSNVIKTEKKPNSNCTVEIKDIRNYKLKKEISVDKLAYVMMRVTDAVGNVSVYIEQIRLIDTTEYTNAVCSINAVGNLNDGKADRKEEYKVGNFTVAFAAGDRINTGFELYVQRIAGMNSNGDPVALSKEDGPLNNVKFETYSKNDNTNNIIYIDNVRFTPDNTGTYMLVIRGYHISGLSTVNIYYIETKPASGSGGTTPAAAVNSLPDSGDLNATYTLNTKFTTKNDNDSYVVRSISGGRMSLMYDQFTAKSSGAYSFTDYTVLKTELSSGTVVYPDAAAKNDYTPKGSTNQGGYSIKVSDTESPEIKIQSAMPVYAALSDNVPVNLPKVSAYSINGIADKVEVKVTDNDGDTVFHVTDSTNVTENDPVTGAIANGGNSYGFYATKHGTYTISYTASINGNASSATYTIRAGDIIPPSFSVVTSSTSGGAANYSVIGFINDKEVRSDSSALAKVNNTFKFGVISVQDEGSTQGYTYSKKLTASNGEVVAEVTSATLKDNGKTITLTMSGQYTVEYSVTDKYNNTTRIKYTITVNSTSTNVSTDAIRTLSIVLIIVGIILIAGVVIYLVRFRKHKR